ncbi:DNA fragmentation factor subunit beta [Eurytemora carolleeae]|uniref:DNA fragmentation factor subunit beta n=1 Tax=Eurytemora carolleeae TaxID=1294199 RepID=UPI000C78C840|nr:DNA fragmentation factor subunit beta [Eurytemora carolleeae]
MFFKSTVGQGYRVALEHHVERRKGIFAENLLDLRAKTKDRFQLKQKPEKLNIFLDDGTEVEDDEYLKTIKPNSLLVVRVEGMKPKRETKFNVVNTNIFDHFLSLVRWSGGKDSIYQEVLEFMREDFETKYTEIRDGTLRIITPAQHLLGPKNPFGSDGKMMRLAFPPSLFWLLLFCCSTRDEDPDWFGDLNTRAKTKEEFMYRNCQARIRGYLSRAELQLKEWKGSMKAREMFQKICESFRLELKGNGFHGEMFQRSAQQINRICDSAGLFKCEGLYREPRCSYSAAGEKNQVHEINPYRSREHRILFSTWNLDHVIERSRSIVPSMIEAVETLEKSKKKLKINNEYFYSLLFTRKNLRLVHIVCHDKQEHGSAKCNKALYFK